MEKGTQAPNYKDGSAYRCMERAAENSEKTIKDANMVMDLLTTHPELDAPLCRLFGIQPVPPKVSGR